MKRHFKRLYKGFIVIFSAAFLIFLAEIKTDGFSLAKIEASTRLNHLWKKVEKREISQEILAILDQPFTYLGKGKQCFAFES